MGTRAGRSSCGLIQPVTPGATNNFHGVLCEFVQDDLFDTGGEGTDEKPKLRRNNPGESLGGLMRQIWTFFFYHPDVFGNALKPAASAARAAGISKE